MSASYTRAHARAHEEACGCQTLSGAAGIRVLVVRALPGNVHLLQGPRVKYGQD